MNGHDLLDAVGGIRPEYIDAAESAVRKRPRRRRVWIGAAAAAACACIALGILVPRISRMLPDGNGGMPDQVAVTSGEAGNTDADAGLGLEADGGAARTAGAVPAASGAVSEDEAAGSSGITFDAADTAAVSQNAAEEALQEVRTLTFNGAYYEAVDSPEVLERYGLPTAITQDLAGQHISWLQPEGAGYQEAVTETGTELLTYAPAPCRGVYLIHDQDHWYAALFCSVLQTDSNSCTELDTLYRFYGVEKPDDISAIYEVDWHHDNILGARITDPEEISEFYRLSESLPCFGNDDFQAMTFDDISEEAQPEAHTAFADDLRVFCIETAAGLRFYLDLHPSYGWMFSGGTLSWYPLDEEADAWIRRNLS